MNHILQLLQPSRNERFLASLVGCRQLPWFLTPARIQPLPSLHSTWILSPDSIFSCYQSNFWRFCWLSKILHSLLLLDNEHKVKKNIPPLFHAVLSYISFLDKNKSQQFMLWPHTDLKVNKTILSGIISIVRSKLTNTDLWLWVSSMPFGIFHWWSTGKHSVWILCTLKSTTCFFCF